MTRAIALIVLCGALSLAELAAAIPRAGGLYEYLRRAYGNRVAFVLGWVKLTLLIPSATGSFAKLSAEALGAFCGLTPNTARDATVAVVTLIVCASVNLFAVGFSTRLQGVVTVLKYLGVLGLAAGTACIALLYLLTNVASARALGSDSAI